MSKVLEKDLRIVTVRGNREGRGSYIKVEHMPTGIAVTEFGSFPECRIKCVERIEELIEKSIAKKERSKLESKVGGWDSLEVFFETTPILKDIYKETVDECLKDNCQSTAVMMIETIRKLMEYGELY